MEDGNDRSSHGKDKGSSAHFECRPVKGEQFGDFGGILPTFMRHLRPPDIVATLRPSGWDIDVQLAGAQICVVWLGAGVTGTGRWVVVI